MKFNPVGTRFTSPDSGYLLYVIDKRANESGQDESSASPPVWRQPQPHPHWHEEHEINIVVEGAARYKWWNKDGEEQEQIVSAGQMLAIPGGILHIHEVSDHVLMRGIWIHPELVANLSSTQEKTKKHLISLCQYHQPLLPQLCDDASLFMQLLEIFDQTQLEIGRNDSWREETLTLMARLATVTFLRLMESRPALISSSAQARIQQVHSWMERHYLERPTLEQLSRRAGLSPSHFSELFRQCFDTSPGAFLLQCRLNFAVELLSTTDLPIAQIADMAAFEYAANFTQLFKEHRGQTPSAFRQSHRKKH
jgi:AraC-like DNA-binding protein/mannose-6-phosphate isomerase-like protein (cupin superfamily)